MRSELIDRMLKKTPLETRVKVTIRSYFITQHGGTLLTPLDENGDAIPEAVETNRKCFEEAEPLLKAVLEDIKKWKEDGCP